jgi:membrane protease YdiL (CAAX protease family)
VVRPLQHALNSLAADGHTPAQVALDCSVQWIAASIATWFMGRFEKRPIEAYGFRKERFARLYLRGAVIGICGLSALLFTIYLTGCWRIDAIYLHGSTAWLYGLEWALAFGLAGLAEETQIHGYLLASLSRGITRWPAAIGLSVAFAALHAGNRGETYAGMFFAASASMAFSYMIWKTKSLALVFGLHAAWDWGESFLYGAPDSGQHVVGYWLQTHFSGPPLLSGGSAGPEGSLIGLPVLLLMAIAVEVTSPRVRIGKCLPGPIGGEAMDDR